MNFDQAFRTKVLSTIVILLFSNPLSQAAWSAQEADLDLWTRTTEQIDLARIMNNAQSLKAEEQISRWTLRRELQSRADSGTPVRRAEIIRFIEKVKSTPEDAFLTFLAAPEFFYSPYSTFDTDCRVLIGYKELFIPACKHLVGLLLSNRTVRDRYVQLYLWTQESSMQGDHAVFSFEAGEARLVKRIVFDQYMRAVDELAKAIEEDSVFIIPHGVESWEYWWHLRQTILYMYLSGDHEKLDDLRQAVTLSLDDNAQIVVINDVFVSWYEHLKTRSRDYVSLQGRPYFEHRPGLSWLLHTTQTVQFCLWTIWRHLHNQTIDENLAGIQHISPFSLLHELIQFASLELPRPVLDMADGPFTEWNIGQTPREIRNRFLTIDPFAEYLARNHKLLLIID